VIAVDVYDRGVSVLYGFRSGHPIKQMMPQSVALTKICRQVHAEARPVFFAINTWYVYTDGKPTKQDTVARADRLTTWMRQLGGGGACLFRAMAIFIPAYYRRDLRDMKAYLLLYENISRCFDRKRIRMSFKMYDVSVPRLREGFIDHCEDVKVCFAVTSSLSQQVEAHIHHIESAMGEAKRQASRDLQPEDLEMFEDNTRGRSDLLRRFADCLERQRRAQSAL